MSIVLIFMSIYLSKIVCWTSYYGIINKKKKLFFKFVIRSCYLFQRSNLSLSLCGSLSSPEANIRLTQIHLLSDKLVFSTGKLDLRFSSTGLDTIEEINFIYFLLKIFLRFLLRNLYNPALSCHMLIFLPFNVDVKVEMLIS